MSVVRLAFARTAVTVLRAAPGRRGLRARTFAAAADGAVVPARCLDADAVFLVTGANRGLGAQFVASLLERTTGTVVAACRDPAALAGRDRVDPQRLDVTDQDSIDALAGHLTEKYGRVDGVFSVAGILGDGDATPGPERALAGIDRDWLRLSLDTNAVGPMMLTKAVAPLLRAKKPRPPSVLMHMSARVGSISDNGLGGWHSYRMSKACLNMAVKGASLELKRHNCVVLAMHPGTCDTDLSKPFQKGIKPEKLLTAEFAVNSMLDVVDGLSVDQTGGYFDYAGVPIEW